MFIIVISLRFIDIISKSWHLLQTFGWNLKPLSKKYKKWQILHVFNSLVLLTLILSETSIILKYSVYNTTIHVKMLCIEFIFIKTFF